MQVSLILCTRNRASRLRDALASICRAFEREPAIEAEIVVVDNASTDGTADDLAKFAATSPIRTVVVSEPRPGLCAARNRGLRSATGDVIAFTDDDCRVSETYASELVAHFAADDGPVLRGGRIELGDRDDLPITIKTEPSIRRLDRKLHTGGFVHGANMAFAREIYERIGDFDERFGAGAWFRAADDADFVYRAYRAGFTVEYVPDMVVTHHHGRRDLDEAFRLHDNYDFGDGALFAKHVMRSPSILRFMVRTLKRFTFERLGREVPALALGRTYGMVLRHNARGFLSYCKHAALGTVSL